MARPPKPLSLSREDYADAPEWFGKAIDVLNPFLNDVGNALNGGLSTENYARQVVSFALTTPANPSDAFTGGKVSVKTKLRPRSVVVSALARRTSSAYTPGTQVFPTLSNSWVALGGTYEAPGYYQAADGRVHLFGVATGGTPSSTSAMFTLPVGMRPAKAVTFPAVSNNAFGRLTVNAQGAVIAEVGAAGAFFALSASFLPTTSGHTVYNPLAPTTWQLTQTGLVQINNIAGLAPLTTYDVTLTLE